MFKEKKGVWKLDDIRSGLFHYHMIDSISFETRQTARSDVGNGTHRYCGIKDN